MIACLISSSVVITNGPEGHTQHRDILHDRYCTDWVLFVTSETHEALLVFCDLLPACRESHKRRTVLDHRLFDWFSSDQHEVGSFRALRRKSDVATSVFNFYLWFPTEPTDPEINLWGHKMIKHRKSRQNSVYLCWLCWFFHLYAPLKTFILSYLRRKNPFLIQLLTTRQWPLESLNFTHHTKRAKT